jgi:hypothetical protein
MSHKDKCMPNSAAFGVRETIDAAPKRSCQKNVEAPLRHFLVPRLMAQAVLVVLFCRTP